jgi:diguanylate cyclase (GGDEF)-like protein/PAS domain S-box-containing protein
MTHRLPSTRHAFQYPSAHTTSVVENLGPDVDQHLADLLESLPEAFVWLDRQGQVTYLNQQAACLLQRPREALLGQTLWEAFPAVVGANFDRRSPAGAPPTACHVEAFAPALHKWLEVHTSPAIHGMAVAFRDITPYKRVETELFALAAIVESSEDAIYSKTPDELVLSWNKGAERLYGYSAHEMIGQPVQMLVPPERRPELAAIMQRLTEQQRIEHFETVRRRKDGQLIDVSVTISPVKDANGTIVGASTIAREVTARKQMEAHLRRSEQRFRALIEQSADGIVLVDHQGRVFYAGPSTTRLLGYTPEALVGRSALELIHPDDWGIILAVLAAIVQEAGKSQRAEFRVCCQDGTLRWMEGTATNLLADPGVGAIVGNYRDISERKQAEERQRVLQERILALATTDPVTGLLNHRALMDRLEQELERAHRYERSCSLLFLDLDHFKALNDGYGHAVGDALLAEFAYLVRTQLRRIDTLGRWGGEEFVVILPELQAEEALHAAEAVRASVAAHPFRVGGGLHLTCSIGLASYPTHAQEGEGWLSAADQAMYGAKRFGRNQVRVANDPAVLALLGASPAEGGREEAMLLGMAEALVTLVEARDQVTGRHSQQVADLVFQLALALGWPASEAQMLTLAGKLHDVGKIAIPDAVLQKPGALTQEEWALIRIHPMVGADVVSHIPALRPLAPVIRAHHERWDGQGYPDRLAGEAIPLGARILMVVDAYLAMSIDRPYRKAYAPAVALRELQRCAGSQFDPQVVEALVSLLPPRAEATPQHA